MGKRGPKPGTRQTPEHRAAISAGMRRHWAQRPPWEEISKLVLAAANAGNTEEASRLLHEFMQDRQLVQMNKMEADDAADV
jgi:hypothetical protein